MILARELCPLLFLLLSIYDLLYGAGGEATLVPSAQIAVGGATP